MALFPPWTKVLFLFYDPAAFVIFFISFFWTMMKINIEYLCISQLQTICMNCSERSHHSWELFNEKEQIREVKQKWSLHIFSGFLALNLQSNLNYGIFIVLNHHGSLMGILAKNMRNIKPAICIYVFICRYWWFLRYTRKTDSAFYTACNRHMYRNYGVTLRIKGSKPRSLIKS